MAEFVPHEIDYTAMEAGKAVRLPKGTIRPCPKCGRNGLELLYSQSRGRYVASYWHVAYKDQVGAAPLLKQACTVQAASKREFDGVKKAKEAVPPLRESGRVRKH